MGGSLGTTGYYGGDRSAGGAYLVSGNFNLFKIYSANKSLTATFDFDSSTQGSLIVYIANFKLRDV